MTEPLRQRIVMSYEFEGFSNSDIHNYITGKLETAGLNWEIALLIISLVIILDFNWEAINKEYDIILSTIRVMGLPVIISTLSNAAHEPLRQRIVMSYEFEGFSIICEFSN